MNKNITKLLLSAALMLCCTFSAWAQLGTPPDDEIWYLTEEGEILDDGDYDVGETLCSLKITEHDSYGGYFYIRFNGNVTEINDEAFYDEDDLTAVSFPNTVVWIGRETDGTGVFEDCDNLELVTVPASVKYIGDSAATSIVINCGGVLVEITNYDDSTVTLYGLKKVEFIKENDVPAVRVTYADDSTATYENPKKVEFEK